MIFAKADDFHNLAQTLEVLDLHFEALLDILF